MDELRFKISAFRPETIPMVRLAEYMTALAALLGNEKSVHFVRLDTGSVEMVHRIDPEYQPKVRGRLTALRHGDAATDVVKAYCRLDDMLANDNADGALIAASAAVVIQFPGKSRSKPVDYGGLTQDGSFDGIPIKIGGRADVVPIHLQEIGPTELIRNCHAHREIARQIAAHLFEKPIRVHGVGRWRRESNGDWTLQRFVINDFDVLDDTPLNVVVARLRSIQGSDWRKIGSPLETLRDLRGNEDNAHEW